MFSIIFYFVVIHLFKTFKEVNAVDFRETNHRWRNFESLSRTRILSRQGQGNGPNWSTTQSSTSTTSSTTSSTRYFLNFRFSTESSVLHSKTESEPSVAKKLEFYRFPFEKVGSNQNNFKQQNQNEDLLQERHVKDTDIHFPSIIVTTHSPIIVLTTESIFDEINLNHRRGENIAVVNSTLNSLTTIVSSFQYTSISPRIEFHRNSDDVEDEKEMKEFFTTIESSKVVSDNYYFLEEESWYTTSVPEDLLPVEDLENVLTGIVDSFHVEESSDLSESEAYSTVFPLNDHIFATDISHGNSEMSDLDSYVLGDIEESSDDNSGTNLLTIASISINSTTILIIILLMAVIFLYIKKTRPSVVTDGTKYWTNLPAIQVADKQKIFPMPCSLMSKNEIEQMKASYF